MLADELVEFLAIGVFFDEVDFHHVHVTEVVEVVVLVPDVGYTTRHSGGEVTSGLAEHHYASACHVFTAMVASTLDDGNGTRVAHAETFAHLAVDVEFAGGGTVESGVAGNDVVLGVEVGAHGRQDGYASAGESLGEIVVAFALELETDAVDEEGTERLSGSTLELHVDGVLGESGGTVFLSNASAEHHARGAVGVADGEVEVDFLLCVDGAPGSLDETGVDDIAEKRVGHSRRVVLPGTEGSAAVAFLEEQSVQV